MGFEWVAVGSLRAQGGWAGCSGYVCSSQGLTRFPSAWLGLGWRWRPPVHAALGKALLPSKSSVSMAVR